LQTKEGPVSAVPVIVRYALRESLRRKVFLVVLLLTAAFLTLYGLATWRAFSDTQGFVGRDTPIDIQPQELTGATVFGLAMFATLFLSAVLAIFLTLGVVRGDAERGLLQPLVVRPVGRSTLLFARFLGAAAVCVAYTFGLYFSALLITGGVGGWWPDSIAVPALELAGGVVIVVALSLLGSVFLSATANGIAIFMLFGGGIVAGLIGQIGRTINSHTLSSIGKGGSWAFPFEALYQDGLHSITQNTTGFTSFALRLGPFGGAQVGGTLLFVWAAAYVGLVGAAALAAFARRDL
jgi:Cu-processing system permease protein